MSNALIAEVALLKRLPRHANSFDYSLLLEPRAATGDLVVVPWRSSSAQGVVVRTKQRSRLARARLKPVTQVVAAGFVTPIQLELTRHLAQHYGVAWGSALELALPLLPNRRFKPAALTCPPRSITRRRVTPVVVTFEQAEARIELIKSLAKRVTARQQQFLLLVPELSYLEQWQQVLQRDFRTVIYSAEASLPAKRASWEAIRQGAAQVIIGTRSVLFLPFARLGGVVVDQADNENYKQYDQNPRYDALEVAQWLAGLSGASYARLTPAPSTDDWQSHLQRTVAWQKISSRQAAAKFTLVDLKQERQGGSRQVLAEPLIERINYILSRHGRIYLYLNRRGTATAVLCRDCGYVAACPICGRSMVWEARQNVLTCFHCATRSAVPLPCPKCRGTEIRYLGTGLGKLEAEVSHRWPGSKPILLEGEVAPEQARAAASAPIVIGSRAAWRYLNLADFTLIALVQPDSELSLPEFRAAEEVWQTARYFLASGAREVWAQTYRPEHHVWQSLVNSDLKRFYEAELKQREQYHYPPFGSLVRFTVQDMSEREALKQARALKTTLQPKLKSGVELSGPYPDYYKQVRGRYRFHLLLRYQRGFNPETLWSVLPNDVIIDRHPRTVLS